MPDANASVIIKRQDGIIQSYPVASGQKIYSGTFVVLNSSGYAKGGGAAAGDRFVGVAAASVDNTTGGNGAKMVPVWTQGHFEFKAVSIGQANVGADMWYIDNQTFDDADGNSLGIKVGKLARYISSTRGVISIGPAVATNYTGDASNLTVSDPGNHFAAAEGTVQTQIQKLAKTIIVTVPRFTGWTKNGSDQAINTLPQLEFPVPVMVKRAYLALGTAPGTGKTLVIKVNDTAAVTIADSNTRAESEDLSITIAADTDLTIAANETSGGSAANADLMLVCQVDDGE